MSPKLLSRIALEPDEYFPALTNVNLQLAGIRLESRVRTQSANMTLQDRIESFTTISATILAQLKELRALHEQVRQAQEAAIARDSIVQKFCPRQEH